MGKVSYIGHITCITCDTMNRVRLSEAMCHRVVLWHMAIGDSINDCPPSAIRNSDTAATLLAIQIYRRQILFLSKSDKN